VGAATIEIAGDPASPILLIPRDFFRKAGKFDEMGGNLRQLKVLELLKTFSENSNWS
jgi:hypothetical protein